MSSRDTVGQGIAHPIAAIGSVALMLDHLELRAEAAAVMDAIRATTAAEVLTPDLGGSATTREVGDAILSHL